jgi:hypothetical protein
VKFPLFFNTRIKFSPKFLDNFNLVLWISNFNIKFSQVSCIIKFNNFQYVTCNAGHIMYTLFAPIDTIKNKRFNF